MADYPPVTSQPEALNLADNYGTTSSDDPLAELEKTSEVQLHLSKKPGEGCCGCCSSVHNINITNESGSTIFTAEDGDFVSISGDCCGGNMVPVEFKAMRNGRPETVVKVERYFGCSVDFHVYCPEGTPIGHVRDINSCNCSQLYEIQDANKEQVFTVRGSCCYGCKSVDNTLMIYDHETAIATLRQRWDNCMDCLPYHYYLRFERNMDSKTKCLLIAAVFRVHFEYSGYQGAGAGGY